jgi:Phage major capsid protein E
MEISCPYTVTEITNKINEQPFYSSPISDLGIFKPKFLTTRKASIEITTTNHCIVPTGNWCCPDYKPGIKGPTRALYKVEVPTTKIEDSIMACDLEERLELFEGVNESALIDVTSLELERGNDMRLSLSTTLEWRRFKSATTGLVYDANGNVLHDAFKMFGVSQASVTMNLTDPNFNPYIWVAELKKNTAMALKGPSASAIRVFLTSEDFDAMILAPAFKDLWKNCCLLMQSVMDVASASGSRVFPINGVVFTEFWEPQICDGYEGIDLTWMTEGVGHTIPILNVPNYEDLIAPRMTVATLHKRAEEYFTYTRWDIENKDVLGIGQRGEMNVLPIVKRPGALFKVIVQK